MARLGDIMDMLTPSARTAVSRTSALLLGLSLLAGCGPNRAPEEVVRNEWASVQEADIRASIVGDDLELLIPVRRVGADPIQGDLRVTVYDVAGSAFDQRGGGQAHLDQATVLETYRVVVPGAGAGLERVDTATMVLGWSVETASGRLYGKRSLYESLGRLDVWLHGPSELSPGAHSPLRVLVHDPDAGAPVVGADVLAELTYGTAPDDHTRQLFHGTTDARGDLIQQIALPDGVDSGRIRVTVTDGRTQVWTTHTVTTRVDNQLYLSSDKTIYKPGQDVQLRLLAVTGSDRLPVADTEASFEARDGEGNKVFRRSARTDAFGVAAITVPTDVRVNEGTWKFSATIDGRHTDLELPVERYNLPVMTLSVTTDRPFALPGELVHGHVDAFYVFGEPVIGADVILDARTAAGIPVANLYGTTDAAGGYDFDVTIPAGLDTNSLEDHGDTLTLNAQVTDTAAQVERGTGSLPLAAAPIIINLIADPAAVVTGQPSTAYLTVSDPLGRPLLADLDVAGLGIDGALATSAGGVAELSFTGPAPDASTFSVTATDGAGRRHTRAFDLAPQASQGVRLGFDRSVYRTGDDARLRVFSPAAGRVYLDVYRGAEGVSSLAVDVMGDAAGTEVSLPITDAMRGLLTVDAFCVTADGTSRTTRPVLVDPEGQLQITIDSDAETYRPGAEARVNVRVTDAAGNPRASSLGLTVVNEASFALGGEPRTSIRDLSGVPTDALPPGTRVFGRGPADLLNIEDPGEREQLAQLLFAEAGEVNAPNFRYDALGEELPQVVSRLQNKASVDANTLLSQLSVLVREHGYTTANASWLAQQGRAIDPFGRPYHRSVEGTDYDLRLVFTSDGPDERPGTRDDVTASAYMASLFWGGYDTDGMYRGGPAEGDFAGAGAAADAGVATPPEAPAPPGASGGTHVRSDFRETVYANPTLITDATGTASLAFPLADSITTWRVSADGSTRDGEMGHGSHSFRTFQSFFVDFSVPTRVTAGDVLELPAVVYNYLDAPTSVTVSVDEEPWFTLDSPATQTISLRPSEVRSVRFRVQVTQAGDHALTLHGAAGDISDALVRPVSVDPDGQPEIETGSGRLNGATTHVFNFPTDTVEGGAQLELVLTPGFAAEAAQGMQSLMQEPNGCFEQTTSSAWPNTMVAKYLELTGQMTPELREQSIGFVTRGYQRLLTFESPTGGFNWWGDSDPGNRILSAIMLWHLKDMEGLIETDDAVRDRTLSWLVSQQNADGSWDAGDALHAGDEVLSTSVVRATSFIAWALAHTGWADDAVRRATTYLAANLPPETDLYANALAANAMAMGDRHNPVTSLLLQRLDTMGEDQGDRGILWPTEAPSWTGASGDAAAIETTGLVGYALMKADAYPADTAGAMRFILANKDAVGTWYNTQATMNALRALSAAATPRGSDAEGTLTVTVNGVLADTIPVNASNGDLLRRFDLTDYAVVGENSVRVEMVGTGEVSYRVTRTAYRPALPAPTGTFSLNVGYDATTTTVGTPIRVTAHVVNNSDGIQDQVMVRVGRAPGFTPRGEDLEAIVASGLASRYEVRSDDVTFYLMGFPAHGTRDLSYRLTPSLVVEALAPASSVYPYYRPDEKQMVDPQRFVVTTP